MRDNIEFLIKFRPGVHGGRRSRRTHRCAVDVTAAIHERAAHAVGARAQCRSYTLGAARAARAEGIPEQVADTALGSPVHARGVVGLVVRTFAQL